jgi:hypothetical protein
MHHSGSKNWVGIQTANKFWDLLKKSTEQW